MWPLLFNFGIAHWAMVDEFVSVNGLYIGYLLPNAHPGFASRTQHVCFLFWHDTQTRQCKSAPKENVDRLR
jgi:hypothetical protein